MLKKLITLVVLLLIIGGIVAIAKNLQPQTPNPKLPPGSAPVGGAADVERITWVWTKTTWGGDNVISPKRPGVFSISLVDGKVTGKTDCNSFFGAYQLGSDGVISFGPLAGTKMFCEGSQESEFIDFISKTNRYMFDADSHLVLQSQDAEIHFKRLETADITLAVGELKTFDDLSITFNKFVQDSRCPIDVQCIQAGAVTVNVTLTDSQKSETKNFPSDEAPQPFGAYRISIIKIEPPRESMKEIAERDYRITFHVEK